MPRIRRSLIATSLLTATVLTGCEQQARASLVAAGPAIAQDSEDAAVRAAREAAAQRALALKQVLGRWSRTAFEDVVFGEDGTLLCDGPGPFDLTGSWALTNPKHLTIHWPGFPEAATYQMSFLGSNTLRLTVPDSTVGAGVTLTR